MKPKRKSKYNGPTWREMSKRLVDLGRTALSSEEYANVRTLGLQWYPSARRWCAQLAARYAEHGATLESVAGAVSALSPQTSWLDQTRYVPLFLESVLVDGDAHTLPHPGFLRNRIRARDILLGGDPSTILSGPKVTAFFRAILGDASAVVIDRHAATLALGYRKESLPLRLVREIQRAYVEAARRVHVDPRSLQSLLWCYYKASGEAERYEAPLYFEDTMQSLALRALGLAWSDNFEAPFDAPAERMPQRAPDAGAPLVGADRAARRETAELPF